MLDLERITKNIAQMLEEWQNLTVKSHILIEFHGINIWRYSKRDVCLSQYDNVQDCVKKGRRNNGKKIIMISDEDIIKLPSGMLFV